MQKKAHNMGEQWSGAWPHESGQTSPMSSGATPPLPLGAYRNRRFKIGEKILSSTRYLAVTWHQNQNRVQEGREERPQQCEASVEWKETKCRGRYVLWHLKGIQKNSRKHFHRKQSCSIEQDTSLHVEKFTCPSLLSSYCAICCSYRKTDSQVTVLQCL